jgi:hypothetical protein
VLGAIKLHDQSALRTDEVHDEAANRMLPTELVTTESSIPQTLPDPSLGISGAAPEPTGKSRPAATEHPHPTPLPTKGEGESDELIWNLAPIFFLTGLPSHPRFVLPLLLEKRVEVRRTLDHWTT